MEHTQGELIPCPFCGGEAKESYATSDWWPQEEKRYTVACLNEACPMFVVTNECETKKEAAEIWNTRTPHASLQAKADLHDELVGASGNILSILLKYFHVWGNTETTLERLDLYPSTIAKAIVAAEQALAKAKKL